MIYEMFHFHLISIKMLQYNNNNYYDKLANITDFILGPTLTNLRVGFMSWVCRKVNVCIVISMCSKMSCREGGHYVIGIIIEWFFVRVPSQYLSKVTLLVFVVVTENEKDANTQHENEHKSNGTDNTS